jgi:N-acetylglucosamine-6-phosphate deacetylase
MPLLDQRRIGLTSIALTDDRLIIELIVDGVHVHPRMIDLACRAKPRSDVVGISDATQGTGLGEGIYRYGDREVRISKGESRLVVDGTLAGSCLTLETAVRNLLAYSSLPVNEALACFTVNPARSVGLADRGVIRPGKRADIAVVDDNWNVRMTIVHGNVVYDRRIGEK